MWVFCFSFSKPAKSSPGSREAANVPGKGDGGGGEAGEKGEARGEGRGKRRGTGTGNGKGGEGARRNAETEEKFLVHSNGRPICREETALSYGIWFAFVYVDCSARYSTKRATPNCDKRDSCGPAHTYTLTVPPNVWGTGFFPMRGVR